MDKGIFEGLKVLDCASFIAAPAAATVLSDFGAEVIKIEPPGAGDRRPRRLRIECKGGFRICQTRIELASAREEARTVDIGFDAVLGRPLRVVQDRRAGSLGLVPERPGAVLQVAGAGLSASPAQGDQRKRREQRQTKGRHFSNPLFLKIPRLSAQAGGPVRTHNRREHIARFTAAVDDKPPALIKGLRIS